MYGSKLTVWWHNFVNGLPVEDNTKTFLNQYGIFGVWGIMITSGLVIISVVAKGC